MTTAVSPTPVKLHPYFTEMPADKLRHHQRRNALFCTAIIISAIGALAIFGSMTAMYLGLLSQSSLSGWGSLAAIGSGVGCMVSIDYFTKKQVPEKWKIEWYREVARCLTIMQGKWDEKMIRKYLSSLPQPINEIRPEVMALLQKQNPTSPLKAFLPLIARTRIATLRFGDWDHNFSLQTKKIGRLRSASTPNQKLIESCESLNEKISNNRMFYAQLAKHYGQVFGNPTC